MFPFRCSGAHQNMDSQKMIKLVAKNKAKEGKCRENVQYSLPNCRVLTLYQPMTHIHICIMSSHKPIRIYMGDLILGTDTLYRLFCFFKLFPMVGKGLNMIQFSYACQSDTTSKNSRAANRLQLCK